MNTGLGDHTTNRGIFALAGSPVSRGVHGNHRTHGGGREYGEAGTHENLRAALITSDVRQF
jgi:hypothetical protein